MIDIRIDEQAAETLYRLGISPFQGTQIARYGIGAILKGRVGSIVEAFSRHPRGTLMHMGAFSYASDNAAPIANLMVGRYCSIAVGVKVMDGIHPLQAVTTSPFHYGEYYTSGNIPEDFVYRGERRLFRQSYGPTQVGHDVWIGSHCTILAGVSIGSGAVIAGGANVVKDVPPYAIVGGNPAKIIRYRFHEELRLRLLDLNWWNISPTVLRDQNMYDPEAFCLALERLRDAGELVSFNPATITVTESGGISENEAVPL